MAQDFHAAFHLNGADDKHINVGDLAGVSLAAIQALYTQAAEREARITQLETRLEKQSLAMTKMQEALEALAQQPSTSLQTLARK